MKGSHSRLLQAVIAAMLLNVAPDGRAETYDLPRVRVQPPDYDWEGANFETYDNWDYNDYYERSGSGGDDSDDDSEEMDEEKKSQCDAIAAKVSASCDLENPPLMVTNGCGSGVSTNLVPDFLMVNGAPVLGLGPIFERACNGHDRCYGTYLNSKGACDLILNADMIEDAKAELTERLWSYYEPFVRVQALAYSAGLQAPFIDSISGEAFKGAQLDGACRVYAGKAKIEGCFD